jgi:hypothetical protein
MKNKTISFVQDFISTSAFQHSTRLPSSSSLAERLLKPGLLMRMSLAAVEILVEISNVRDKKRARFLKAAMILLVFV